jgi:Type ISP C-terminal specificity domain
VRRPYIGPDQYAVHRALTKTGSSAVVRFRSLPKGRRESKFEELAKLRLNDKAWTKCPVPDRAPFLPESTGLWSTFAKLDELFIYNGAGIQPKRTWVVAPDAESLQLRWRRLIEAPVREKEDLFHPTLRDGVPADRHVRSIIKEAIPGFRARLTQIVDERDASVTAVRIGFRSFDRQWIIPDSRVITQPNAVLWATSSERQIYATALSSKSPTSGPSVTFTALVPENDHYKGSFSGRVFPLWGDHEGAEPNLKASLLAFLSERYACSVSAEHLMAYIAAVAANPTYTYRFQDDLSTPGLRIPIPRGHSARSLAVGVHLRTLERLEYSRPAHRP